MMIFCILQQQAEILIALESFEIDMCYKRIKDTEWKEVVIAKYFPMHGKVITLARCYMSMESSEGYYLFFSRLFDLIERLTSKPFLFHYQCGQGLKAILMDMDSKQMSGKIKHVIGTLLIWY